MSHLKQLLYLHAWICKPFDRIKLLGLLIPLLHFLVKLKVRLKACMFGLNFRSYFAERSFNPLLFLLLVTSQLHTFAKCQKMTFMRCFSSISFLTKQHDNRSTSELKVTSCVTRKYEILTINVLRTELNNKTL